MSIIEYSNMTKIVEESKKWPGIKCPFCFGYFTPFTTAFRVSEDSALSDADLRGVIGDERENEKKYLKRDDPKLEEFWSKYAGGEVNYQDLAPVIHNTSNDPEALKGHFELDAAGFPLAVIDQKGHKTKDRICPHCHNKLPFEFGKYPVKYIAMVGITSSGKTVFLSRLLKQIKDNMLLNVGLNRMTSIEEIDAFLEKYPIKMGQPLPKPSVGDTLTPPLPVSVVNRYTNKKYSLVFYDIAGENCTKPDGMEKYGAFVKNADGIIVLVDPLQLNDFYSFDLDDDGIDDIMQPNQVLFTMYQNFLAESLAEGEKSKVPLAAALSKSDLLKESLGSWETNLYKNVNYKAYPKKGFVMTEHRSIDMEVRRILEKSNMGQAFLSTVVDNFARSALFAFTALNAIPEKSITDRGNSEYKLASIPMSFRIEEPLFWILFQLGVIGNAEMAEEDRNRRHGGLFGRR